MLAAAIGAIPLATFEATESIPLTAPYLRSAQCHEHQPRFEARD
jgi:hypothetical protein